MLPFDRRTRRKGKKGKESPLWVSYEKEERCMVDLDKVVVDVACARDLFLCYVLFQRKRNV